MIPAQNDHIVESYWELLRNLDVNTRLALMARLVQSLQADATGSTGAFSGGDASGVSSTATGQTSSNDAFWWDELEG